MILLYIIGVPLALVVVAWLLTVLCQPEDRGY
jgi:hypothetical protein